MKGKDFLLVSVRVPGRWVRDMDKLAYRTERTRSGIIRLAIRQYLVEQRRKDKPEHSL